MNTPVIPCCGKFHPCRLYHDANYLDSSSDECDKEIMDRFNVKIIRCRNCLCQKPPTNQCIQCRIQFAKYFCSICKFYEDEPTKDIYHCDEYKMCRRESKKSIFIVKYVIFVSIIQCIIYVAQLFLSAQKI